ncbi:MAG: hypothetical protein U1B80_05020 [Anaerolineaceae bacterium]|nr:hypothetical protein [Anaerolineaceae bacterium]
MKWYAAERASASRSNCDMRWLNLPQLFQRRQMGVKIDPMERGKDTPRCHPTLNNERRSALRQAVD